MVFLKINKEDEISNLEVLIDKYANAYNLDYAFVKILKILIQYLN